MASGTEYKFPPVMIEDGDTPADVVAAWEANNGQ